MPFSIKTLTSYNEMLLVHELQHEIWGVNDPLFALYPPLMNTAAKNGGVVLGAFDDSTGEMIAFLFGFLGREGDGPFKLCSQVMGVLPGWRGQGVAEALKQAQRRQVIAQELPLITWTYDPLEAPNAHLNLHKLRGISRTYWEDVYGSDFGSLNAGLPTDRLVVEWWVNGERLARRWASTDEPEPVFQVAGRGTARFITRARLNLNAPVLELESLPDLHAVKSASLKLALDWRLHVRTAFQAYFTRGYIATDFLAGTDAATGERRNRYILRRATPELLAHIGVVR
ncbi:MAG: hypothetical protein Kow0031_27290 [Anaerolineae bacterium]